MADRKRSKKEKKKEKGKQPGPGKVPKLPKVRSIKEAEKYIQLLEARTLSLTQKIVQLELRLNSLTDYTQQTEVKRAAMYRLLEGKYFTPDDFNKSANGVVEDMKKEMEKLVRAAAGQQEQGKPVENKDHGDGKQD